MAYLHMNFRSDCISRSVYPVVFLPDLNLWRDVEPPYPTLYFLPGYSGGGLETAMFSNFALFAMRFGVAVVLADGENSFYTDDEQRGALFSRYVGEELVEVTRSVLPLSHRREDTFIGGISMGGYGALINGLRYKENFSKIVMLSPALGFKTPDEEPRPDCPSPKGELIATLGTWAEYAGSYRDYLRAATEAAKTPDAVPDMFLACGQADTLIEPAREFAAHMDALHAPLTWYEAAGGHDHTFWKQALNPAFRFLTGKEDA
ncbi:MAG: hypothetical protein J5556_05555 [Deltaproteobacteria bacterium]|nr:hypothetical protein [Deltaproteobacteria bacterium]